MYQFLFFLLLFRFYFKIYFTGHTTGLSQPVICPFSSCDNFSLIKFCASRRVSRVSWIKFYHKCHKSAGAINRERIQSNLYVAPSQGSCCLCSLNTSVVHQCTLFIQRIQGLIQERIVDFDSTCTCEMNPLSEYQRGFILSSDSLFYKLTDWLEVHFVLIYFVFEI